MAVQSVWPVVREILSANLSLTADEVITKAKAKGVKEPDDVIRTTVHNVRKKLKRKAAAPAPKPLLSAARKTTAPAKPASASAVSVIRTSELKQVVAETPVPATVAPALSPAVGLSAVLSNVALVNAAVAASGGVEQARQVAEAVRACGGPEAFAQYLDLVAGIRAA